MDVKSLLAIWRKLFTGGSMVYPKERERGMIRGVKMEANSMVLHNEGKYMFW